MRRQSNSPYDQLPRHQWSLKRQQAAQILQSAPTPTHLHQPSSQAPLIPSPSMWQKQHQAHHLYAQHQQ